ncbi:uncharacterized protein Z518_03561 [Rhinocladiella mackenziei CBS 650.93]|uniref:Polyketide synthase n=1 Tax=Rhinocladiella mackenziei CBS 650.93 TaxID=1442369 RepID=A0A0D2ISD2_9EURO|nr:uncharacterized protein Z518_03561 [Rhinocladiella mackenziei CBS 650.93]KIX08904.1 hypothetical protein Z518_03561 [Rhinocladiella mackenziei CBS 650.93]
MGRDIKVLQFGDQSEHVIDDLRDLLAVKDNPLLNNFFDKAYITLRDEVAHLPNVTRGLPGFTSVETLLWRYTESGVQHPAIESALVYIHQVASLLRHYGDGADLYPKADTTRIVGSCTGLLSAAAVSSARTYRELVSVAIEVLKLAFRVGAQVAQVCDELKQTSPDPGSWAAIFPGVGKESAYLVLEKFAKDTKIPPTSRPYVSATSLNSVTVSAPPSELDRLVKSGVLKSSRPIRIPIYGPYHAPHYYSEGIVTSLVNFVPESVANQWTPRIPIIANAKDHVYHTSNLHQLLKEVLDDILLKPLHWDRLCTNCVASVSSADPENCQVVPIAAKNASTSLINALTQKANFKVTLDDRAIRTTEDSHRSKPRGRLGKSKIAIVGMSGRFPDASSPSDFWDLLKKGLDVHREIPSDRFDAQAHYDPTGKRKNTSHTPYGCFVEHPGLFDAKFFNMSPKEATQTDPMHRLALITAYEALEMSGFVPNRTPSTRADRVGTFYGQTSDDWREIQDGQNIQTYFIPGGVRAFAPGRINYHFGFSGPSFSVDTACSSSLAAINIACNSLWLGECDTALAGGLNILTNPDIFAGLSRGQFLSKTGNCKTFDDGADGYCRGDGAGSVVLKRLEDAEADNDPILAVILGTGTNHSADAVSITHPHAGAQEYLFKKTLTESGVDPHDISYVEMHGTGTQAGDAIEMESVLNSFAPEGRKRDHPLYLGSVKANVGHGEAASGITALVKILLMLEHDLIPPHCGIKNNINRKFPDLAARNVHISRCRESEWKRPAGGKRRMFLNNFSAAGGNTSLLMEDGPLMITNGEDPRSTTLVAVSGKTKNAFIKNTENLIKFLAQNRSTDLPSLSYTTTARRVHYPYRTMVAGSDLSTIEAGLKKSLSSDVSAVPGGGPPVVFAFTGQGSHYTAMGKQLYNTNSQFRSDIDRFDLLAQNQGFPAILPLVNGSAEIESLGPVVVQTGAICIQIALVRLWAAWGIKPAAVIGHSLGEYAALHAAGVLSINDAIFLAGTRAKLLDTHCTRNTHAMLAVSAPTRDLEDYIDGKDYELACVNGPKATVIGGESSNIDRLREKLTSEGTKCTKLHVPFAFHSSQVDPALEEFEAAASHVTFKAPMVPLISPLLSGVITDDKAVNATYLRRHCRLPVNFLGALQAAKDQGVIKNNSIFLEIGSHPICTGMVKASLGSTTVALASLRRDEDVWKVVTGSLCALYNAGLKIDWNYYHQDFPRCHNTLRLPAYSWDATNYWIDYQNNWTLTKGEAPAVKVEKTASLETSTVQRVVEEKFQGQKGTITTETDISRPDLEETIKGHIVNGSALCSSAVYADMALTIGHYVHRKLEPSKENLALNCSDMVVEKPLVARGGSEAQLLRATCSADLSQGVCNIHFYSVDAKGKTTVEHARCQIKYGDTEKWSVDLSRQNYLISSQVDRLLQSGQKGELSRLQRKMAYKLFSALVDYQDAYKGMADVILDSPNREGTARVELPGGKNGQFFMAPYHIDSLCHLAGFIMNANDELDSTKTVFVNHGWQSLRFTRKPSPNRTYRSYVRMQPTGPNSKDYSGDVYVFDEDGEIIGLIGGLEFQFLPKQVLDRVLPQASGVKTAASTPAKKASPAPKKAAPKPAAPKPRAAPGGPTTLTRALDIMAEEIGVPISEFTDDCDLSSLGVDSLMSLTISGKFREELDIEVPSTLLTDAQTFKEVKDFLSQFDFKSTPAQMECLDDSSAESTDMSGVSTPYPGDSDSMTSLSEIDAKSTGEDIDKDDDKVSAIRAAIAEETGLDPSEVTSSTELASVGIDSLMSLQILGILREEQGLDLPPTFFSDHDTFGDIERALGGGAKPKLPTDSEKMSTTQVVEKLTADKCAEKPAATPARKSKPSRQATSVLLQGNPKTAPQTLFIFPDGSGSAVSYATIPPIAPKDVALIGLNCPFMKTADEFDCGIEGVVSLYLEEIRRRQPKGPYILGGWSAGGICAYEACLQLQAAGEVVEKLIYLDVPCPLPPQALPTRLHQFFDSIGLLGAEGEAPAWLLPHFSATIRALSNYRPRLMDPARDHIPKTYTIMARDGVCKHENDPRPELSPDDPPHMSWLLFNRTDFGSIGWEKLLGSTDNIISLEPISDVNHFTMMREPHVREIPSRLRQALGVSG